MTGPIARKSSKFFPSNLSPHDSARFHFSFDDEVAVAHMVSARQTGEAGSDDNGVVCFQGYLRKTKFRACS